VHVFRQDALKIRFLSGSAGSSHIAGTMSQRGVRTTTLLFTILFFLPIEALSRLSKLWRKFLQEPHIAIGVAEASILHTTEICDLADFKFTFNECFTSRIYIRYNQVQPLTDPGGISEISDIPVPITIEQAEPGGVNWTTLIVSVGWVSTFNSNPAFS